MSSQHKGKSSFKNLSLLSLTSLGIVYGDIGTSPLYALRECFHISGIQPTQENVLGILSLIFWSLTLIIAVKYIIFVLRADNNGEGGTLALGALCTKFQTANVRNKRFLMSLALLGAALLFGDGIITPAVTVLSAFEGLNVATTEFSRFVVPVSILTLIFLFLGQSRGTDKIGRVFGPLMLVWFVYLAALGVKGILLNPSVLAAINPMHAVEFFSVNRFVGFVSLGTVFLVVTGGEALYADMGHFGPKPIRLSWFYVVFPALLLTYFGQGALILQRPETVANPFYELVPRFLLYPSIALAVTASAIASQAVISGVFSMASQAIQLGYCPRFPVNHTSSDQIGQVYLPHINFMMLILTIVLVLTFKSSSGLAAAYGVAVSLTMVLTVLLVAYLAHRLWRWRLRWVLLFLFVFLTIDLAFLAANLLKFTEGGWFPLVFAVAVFTLMTTWRRGRRLLAVLIKRQTVHVDELENLLLETKAVVVPGVAVFMTSNSEGLPPALVHNLRHNKVIHRKNLFLTLTTAPVPFVPFNDQVKVDSSHRNYDRIVVTSGFREIPNVQQVIRQYEAKTGQQLEDITYFIGRETLIPTDDFGLPHWQAVLFLFMSRNSQRATQFFGIPPDNVVEIGMQLKI